MTTQQQNTPTKDGGKSGGEASKSRVATAIESPMAVPASSACSGKSTPSAGGACLGGRAERRHTRRAHVANSSSCSAGEKSPRGGVSHVRIS